MIAKLTPEQYRRIEEIEEFQRTVDLLRHLVAELEGNRAAATRVVQGLCDRIAKEASQLRQRALSANIGTIEDVAGAMAVMAGRSAGMNMKIRGLADGVNSLGMQLDVALKQARTPEAPKPAPGSRPPA